MLKSKILQLLLCSSIPRHMVPKLLAHVKTEHIYNDVHMTCCSHYLNLHSEVIIPEQPSLINQCKIALFTPSPNSSTKASNVS